MRIVDKTIREIRRKVFYEVAKLAFDGDYTKVGELPYRILPGVEAQHRSSIFLERAIVGERIRLAIGLPLRAFDAHAPLATGISESAIDEKFYDPPLINIIKFACNACPDKFVVSDCCQGCLSHPCLDVCHKGAVSMRDGKSVIDEAKCVKCGRCKEVCPYSAIIHMKRPCSAACGVDAIDSDENRRAVIDYGKCVACGMCIVSCPFGAISDKGQIFQLAHALNKHDNVIAIVAPSFVGQFGATVTPAKFVLALKQLGFSDVVEVAVGADLCAIEEAKDFIALVPEKQAFMATSCCPSWIMMAKKQFPELRENISLALTPMVLTARLTKKKYPDSKIVFVGPCTAKKLEASRKSVRSDVDFVITFEELMAMFDAKNISLKDIDGGEELEDATAAGRGFAVSGGVASAVVEVINRLEPDKHVDTVTAEGLKNCRVLLEMASKGKYDGYLLEGMACPGGCVAGTGTLAPSKKTTAIVAKYKSEAIKKNALESEFEAEMDFTKE